MIFLMHLGETQRLNSHKKLTGKITSYVYDFDIDLDTLSLDRNQIIKKLQGVLI